MKTKTEVDSNSVLIAVRQIAEAAIEKFKDGKAPRYEFVPREACLLLCDGLDDQIIESLMDCVPRLDGWQFARGQILADLMFLRFEDDAEALAYVRERAASGEPGTKLHRVALALRMEGMRPIRRSPGKRGT